MQRYASVVGIRPERLAVYKQLHAAVWPAVLAKIADCNIRNYSIFEFNNLLFAYYEYHGSDHDADMARMATDPMTQEWWAINSPMQVPVPQNASGKGWMQIEEVFHTA